MFGHGEGYEGEGELALERVGDADYTGFGDQRMAGDCLLDGAYCFYVNLGMLTIYVISKGKETQLAYQSKDGGPQYLSNRRFGS